MRFMATRGLSASSFGFALALALRGVAAAQGDAPAAGLGVVTGEVAHCVNGAEQATAQVAVGVEGGGASLARTDANGEFLLALPAGQYTVVATANDGTASRQYVPVTGGQTLDIGVLDIGGGVAGCGPDEDITAPVLPTFTPTLAASAATLPLTPEPPTPQPTAQPVPSSATPEPDPAMQPPADSAEGA